MTLIEIFCQPIGEDFMGPLYDTWCMTHATLSPFYILAAVCITLLTILWTRI